MPGERRKHLSRPEINKKHNTIITNLIIIIIITVTIMVANWYHHGTGRSNLNHCTRMKLSISFLGCTGLCIECDGEQTELMRD